MVTHVDSLDTYLVLKHAQVNLLVVCVLYSRITRRINHALLSMTLCSALPKCRVRDGMKDTRFVVGIQGIAKVSYVNDDPLAYF